MDGGTDPENLISKPEALEELSSPGLRFTSLRVAKQDGRIRTRDTAGHRIETPESSTETRPRKTQSMARSVDGAP